MAKAAQSLPPKLSEDLLPLFEFSNVVNAAHDLKFILGTVLLTVMGKMLVARGAVLLKRERDTFEVVAARGLGSGIEGSSVTLQTLPKIIRDPAKETKGRSRNKWFLSHDIRLLVPILSNSSVVGYLALGGRVGRKPFSAPDRKLITSLVNLSAAAVEKAVMVERLKEAHRSLDRKLQELKTLFELSKEFNLVLNADKVIRLLTFSLLGQIGVNRYAVCLVDGGTIKIVASRLSDDPALLRALQDFCDLKNPMLIREIDKKLARSAAPLKEAGVQLMIPMHVQNRTKGVILLGEKLGGSEYSKEDLEFLYSLANLAIISIENARLFQETLEKQRLEDELKIAREIQQGLLPQTLPAIGGYDLAAANVSSKQVGGDYYDVIRRSDTEYVIAIGDVSGKGTPAALLMASIQAALRALVPLLHDLPEATGRMNDLACENTGGDTFITFFWGIIDTARHQLRYVNAGHNPPFLIRKDGSVIRLQKGGLILGMMKTKRPYEEGEVELKAGDLLFLFTDGVSEAMNARGEDFTEERLESILKSVGGSPAREILQHVRMHVQEFSKGTQQSDDITMLVVNVG
ncbi:MAG: SpoIIE family protein phosphatase [Ignavibacteriales bacterium]|nr:SpoIIE family protein phosphatase [Ignavibacteriales bacterium]